MKYLRRALKYLIQLSLIFVLIIGILMLSGMISKDVTVAFQNGWTSILYIFCAFAAMSLVYPFFGYGKRIIRAEGDPAENWPAVEEAMEIRHYKRADDLPDGSRRYVLQSPVNRAARLWEDAITLTPVLGGLQAEGLSRDLARVAMTIDRKLNHYGN